MNKADQKYEKYVARLRENLDSFIGLPVVVKQGYEDTKGILIRYERVYKSTEMEWFDFFNLELYQIYEGREIPEEKEARLELEPDALIPFDFFKDRIQKLHPKLDFKQEIKIDVFVLSEEQIEQMGSCYSCMKEDVCRIIYPHLRKFIAELRYSDMMGEKDIEQQVKVVLGSNCTKYVNRTDWEIKRIKKGETDG